MATKAQHPPHRFPVYITKGKISTTGCNSVSPGDILFVTLINIPEPPSFSTAATTATNAHYRLKGEKAKATTAYKFIPAWWCSTGCRIDELRLFCTHGIYIYIYTHTTRWRGRSWIMSWDSSWRLSWRCLACRRSTYQPNVGLSPPPCFHVPLHRSLVFRLPTNAGFIPSLPTS